MSRITDMASAMLAATHARVPARGDELVPRMHHVADGAPARVLFFVPGIKNDASRFDVLARQLSGAGHRVYVQPQPERGFTSLEQSADDTAALVDVARRDAGVNRIDLGGFSRGGLVGRLYVAERDGLAATRAQFTLASPHGGVTSTGVLGAVTGAAILPPASHGAVRAAFSGRTARVVNGALDTTLRGVVSTAGNLTAPQAAAALQELVVGSPALRRLDASLDDLYGIAWATQPDWRLTTVYGRLPGRASDGIVTTESAAMRDANPLFVRRIELTDARASHRLLPQHGEALRVISELLADGPA